MAKLQAAGTPSNEALLRLLALLSDSALCNCAGSTVFQRGQSYAIDDAVQDVEWAPSKEGAGIDASATVAGTHAYSTELWMSLDEAMVEDDALDGDCDCPHSQDGNFCKHLVALALTLRGMLGGDAQPHNPESQKKVVTAAKRANTQATNRDKLQTFVQTQSASVLAERLWQWAQADRGLMANLKSWAAQTQAGNDPKAMKAVISGMLKDTGFIDWRAASDYARRAENVLPLLEQAQSKDPVQALALCEFALKLLYAAAEQTDDSDGLVGDLMQEVQDLLIGCVQAAAPPASWLVNWFQLMETDPIGNWDEQALLKVAGPALQQAYSRKVAADWLACQSGTTASSTHAGVHRCDYPRYKVRRRYLDDLQRREEPVVVMEAMHSSAQSAREHSELVVYCEAVNKFREALQFAQAASNLFPADAHLEDDLLRCFERDGWDVEALVIRRRQLEKSPTPERFLATLQAAKAAGKDVASYRDGLYRWAEERERQAPSEHDFTRHTTNMRVPARDVGLRVQWLLAEGQLDKALMLVQPPHVCRPGLLESIARQLPKAQHAAAVPLLLRSFAAQMLGASSPYSHVLTLVRDACKRMPAIERSQWLARLRQEYKAKRNFIKGLEGL